MVKTASWSRRAMWKVSSSAAAIFRDPELRGRLAGAADQGLAEFERETMVRQQEELYRELASKAGLEGAEPRDCGMQALPMSPIRDAERRTHG